MLLKVVLITVLLVVASSKHIVKRNGEVQACKLKDGLAKEIASYESVVKRIVDYVRGPFKGRTYNELATFINKFGPRPSGSKVLEQSIDYMVNLTRQQGINDVVTEPVEVPYWNRGDESVTMIKPRIKKMPMLGLGGSISTPKEGITAEVIAVSSFDEFDSISEEMVKGKIVLFNAPYVDYHVTVRYRTTGASVAAKKGAIASLIRSITPYPKNIPHTGYQNYKEGIVKIPTAAITIEDSELISRIIKRGEKVVVTLKMSSTAGTSISRNTLVDLKGRESPEKLVIVSGHIDSWDVGVGAMDDGGGLFVSWAAPVILNNLNLKPRRTIRAIFWTAEEFDITGAIGYAKKHINEMKNVNFAMESDMGTFKPLGLGIKASPEAICIVAEILKLLKSINTTTIEVSKHTGPDNEIFTSRGIPGGSLLNENGKYFWYHHSVGDTMKVENPDELDLGAALWAAAAYVIADISADIPR